MPTDEHHDDGAELWSVGDEERYPTLIEFLGRRRYDDGSERTPGTLLLFVEGGRLKMCFNDRDGPAVGFMALEGLTGALDAAEAALLGDKIDWRAPRGQGGPRRK